MGITLKNTKRWKDLEVWYVVDYSDQHERLELFRAGEDNAKRRLEFGINDLWEVNITPMSGHEVAEARASSKHLRTAINIDKKKKKAYLKNNPQVQEELFAFEMVESCSKGVHNLVGETINDEGELIEIPVSDISMMMTVLREADDDAVDIVDDIYQAITNHSHLETGFLARSGSPSRSSPRATRPSSGDAQSASPGGRRPKTARPSPS